MDGKSGVRARWWIAGASLVLTLALIALAGPLTMELVSWFDRHPQVAKAMPLIPVLAMAPIILGRLQRRPNQALPHGRNRPGQ